jgi:hypothetical protein
MGVTLTPSPAGPQPVGTQITWKATVGGAQPASLEFQFQGGRSSHAPALLRGFYSSNEIVWAPSEAEGTYGIRVTARNRATGEIAVADSSFDIVSNVIGDMPAISPTANPLVALYSAPGCPTGSTMYVTFTDGISVSNTDSMPCTQDTSMNFYIGGMLPSTAYDMNYVVVPPPPNPYPNALDENASSQVPAVIVYGPVQRFTTGTVPTSLAFPTFSTIRVPDSRNSLAQGILLLDYLSPPNGTYYFPTAVDLQGRVVWYYPELGVPAQGTTYFIRPVPNSHGHMLLIANDPSATYNWGQILREIDIAGNTVSEIRVEQINEQLAAMGKLGITEFNHDAIRLPNGHTLLLASQEKIYPAGTQGSQTPVDLVGNAIVDLDQNWNVAWSWSAYDYLDTNRAAVLNETCAAAQPGCPQLTLATNARDWLHANSLNYLPDSGDILMSIRHQDWVIKIDYAAGAGTGNVLWKLGAGGDFSIQSNDPYPWFSHQHDAQFDPSTGMFLAFDNGNTRIALAGGVGNSRGYVMQLDEVNMIATPVLLADLGVYATAVGSAQLLDNGNYHFHAGMVPNPSPHAFSFETAPDGSQLSIFEELDQVYRSYRMSSLYSLN